jgi:hypothetical protein
MKDDWYNFRKDHKLTAHSELKGNITKPSVKWEYFLGGSIRDIYTTNNSTKEKDLLYTAGGSIVRKHWTGKTVWISEPVGIEGISFVLDLDEDGSDEIVASNTKELFVFSSVDGKILFRYYFGSPLSSGAAYSMIIPHKFRKDKKGYQVVFGLWSSKSILVFDFSLGAGKGKLLHHVKIEDGFHPTVLAADIDCDGVDEIIVTKLGAIYYIDYETGKQKKYIEWISGGERRRNYGFFQLIDINNDNVPECVVISSLVTRHLSGIANDGKGNLTVLWDRFIEHIYPTDTTEVRFTFNSVQDVDGDGYPEIIASFFNTRKDNRWWTEIIDPLTGKIKHEIPDMFLWGLQDIDSDNLSELFLSKEFKRMPEEYADLYVYDFNGKDFTQICEHKNSRFAGRYINSNDTKAIFRAEFLPEEIWFESVSGKKCYITLKQNGKDSEVSANFYHSDQNKKYIFKDVGTLNVGLISDLNNDGLEEIVLISDFGKTFIMDINGKILSEFQSSTTLPFGLFDATRPLIAPVAFTDKDKSSSLLIPNHYGETVMFKFDRSLAKPVQNWRGKYFGKRGWNCNYHFGYVQYIDNEPRMLLLSNEEGYPILNVLSVTGEVIKKFEFPDFPNPKYNNRLGLYEWQFVECSPKERYLILSFYSSTSMNSEEMICLDYDSQKIVWQRKEVGSGDDGRGFGPYGLFSHFINNGEPEAFLLAKDTFCHFKVRTGEYIGEPILLKKFTEVALREKGMFNITGGNLSTNSDPFSAYGSITIADVNNDKIDEYCVLGCFSGFGILDRNHTPLWWKSTPLSDLCMRYPGLADIDNDGCLELGVGHINGEFKCYSAKDGSLKWEVDLKTITSDIVTCDIDNDGFIEFIFGTSDGRLIALGDKGRIKWETKFSTSMGNPIIVDFDGDGLAEIFVVSGDGYLYWIK